jgi:hypothetical protein
MRKRKRGNGKGSAEKSAMSNLVGQERRRCNKRGSEIGTGRLTFNSVVY